MDPTNQNDVVKQTDTTLRIMATILLILPPFEVLTAELVTHFTHKAFSSHWCLHELEH